MRNHKLSLSLAVMLLGWLTVLAGSAAAGELRQARHARFSPWHGPYYHTAWGRPVALVTPPTAGLQTHWGWGVGQTTVGPIYHQFGRPYVSPQPGYGAQLSHTPVWPSHTDQFGVYYVRGPYGRRRQ